MTTQTARLNSTKSYTPLEMFLMANYWRMFASFIKAVRLVLEEGADHKLPDHGTKCDLEIVEEANAVRLRPETFETLSALAAPSQDTRAVTARSLGKR